jgi:hypothetical protein
VIAEAKYNPFKMGHKVLLPDSEANYLFFTTVIEHGEVWYKVAVAEEVYEDEGGPEASGSYTVLLQSEKGMSLFNMHKDAEGLWEPDIVRVPYELLFKIGTLIEQYHT